MTAPLLIAEGLRKTYPRPRRRLLRAEPPLVALEDASFAIAPGETLGIVGESGSGKTTLARLVMGFERPDAGCVRLDGQDIHALPPRALQRLRPRFQMIFQDPYGSLDPRRQVGWSIAEPLRAAGITGRTSLRDRVAEALEQVGLSAADAARYPHEFSGGQRQRIAIARAVVTRPALLVADEAVSALDVSVRAQILNLLMDLQEAMGLGLLFIGHDMAVIAALCDSILVMQEGRVVEAGPTARLITAPAHPYTRALMDAARGETLTRGAAP
ncbi:ATP-binding cassette domain-containing protein [Pseudoroseicyclus aestuarii]|uniref:Peptide/nickel transport system ATP-binding protein n=1 Tax=Pseudoroseicyclus aestuarii TaxID=1795041 RepID=A0A318SU51_9RHOB|nr:ATP-binding cassette domain-containing protein [Pseudoroseicyclus aestuarii]PYE84885.1 peptide/nickel transport system ATP-binding protein [Pseudoroseicyclus aestuarii]